MPMTATPPDSTAMAGFEVRLCRSGKPGDPLTDADRLWPALMRRVGQAHLRLWGLDGLADTAELLISELVTNEFEHGEGAVGVRLWRTDAHLCIEVGSDSMRVPQTRRAGPLDENGRGLHLVAACSDGWGVTPDGTGTWCALTLSPGSP
ncbi:ATP-binding protein [Streptomyces sp. NPDC004838]